MPEPIPAPILEDDEDLKAFLNRPPYDPASALAKAQAVFPAGFNPDTHWLALVLILANSRFAWMLRYMNWGRREVNCEAIQEYYGMLSGGEYVLTVLALHLFNNYNPLWKDGLVNLCRLDEWHFELAMHAIRIHSRGLK